MLHHILSRNFDDEEMPHVQSIQTRTVLVKSYYFHMQYLYINRKFAIYHGPYTHYVSKCVTMYLSTTGVRRITSRIFSMKRRHSVADVDGWGSIPIFRPTCKYEHKSSLHLPSGRSTCNISTENNKRSVVFNCAEKKTT